MNINESQLKQALRDAFAEGWNSTGQGCNAEHHSLSSEELSELRDDAIAGVMDKLKAEASPLVVTTQSVKLVDTAGTLRLDLNDRRTHMTREQALELFVALGVELGIKVFVADCDDAAEQVSRAMVSKGIGHELFVELGSALDDGDGRSVGCAEGCGVGLFVVDDSPAGFVHVDAHREGGESVFMSLTRADAIKAAVSMVAIAKGIPA